MASFVLSSFREHSAGLNCGRWDYMFSVVKRFRNDAAFTFPDRAQVPFAIVTRHTCHTPQPSSYRGTGRERLQHLKAILQNGSVCVQVLWFAQVPFAMTRLICPLFKHFTTMWSTALPERCCAYVAKSSTCTAHDMYDCSVCLHLFELCCDTLV